MRSDVVVITGLGVVSPLGLGTDDFWQALSAGRSGIGEIRGFDPGPGRPRLGAEVPDFPAERFLPAALVRRMDRLSRMIGVASVRAAADAGLDVPNPYPGDDLGVVVGSALGNMSESAQFLERVFHKGPSAASPMLFPNLVLNAAASQVAMALGWRGPNLTVSEGEISGEVALETALGLLRRGRAAAAIAAAGDELAAVVFRSLKDFRQLSPRRSSREWSSPFDRGANGPVAGEGAAAVVLEIGSAAERRGARVYAEIESIRRLSLPSSSPHLWPAPGSATEIDGAAPPELAFSGADSSPERDRLELELLSRLANEKTIVFSPKGAIGENGSAGLINVLVAGLCLGSGVLPPMASLEQPPVEYPFVYPKEPIRGNWRRAMVLGSSRGGAVVAIDLRL